MTTQQIADKLVAYCQSGSFETAQMELYADNVISIEPADTPEYEKQTSGKDAVLAKIRKFDASIEKSYGNTVSKPIVAGNSIAFSLEMDIAMKGKERMKMTELCIYETKDGKVVSEQFFM